MLVEFEPKFHILLHVHTLISIKFRRSFMDENQRVSYNLIAFFKAFRMLVPNGDRKEKSVKVTDTSHIRISITLTGGVEAALTTKKELLLGEEAEETPGLPPSNCLAVSTEEVKEDETNACAAMIFDVSSYRTFLVGLE